MKKLMTIGLLLGGLFLVQSCSKEEGPVGPQGPQGATGATGAAGQNGVSGAVAFTFTNQNNGATGTLTIDSSVLNASAILVYYQDAYNSSPIWYQAPGIGANAAYQTRYYINVGPTLSTFTLSLYDVDGSTYSGAAVTLSEVKVVLIPHTLFGKKAPVDYSDYRATMRYYGLAE